MATNLTVIFEGRRKQIQVPSPQIPVFYAFLSACSQFNIFPKSYSLNFNQKPLDLALPIRLSGPIAKSTLELTKLRSPQPQRVKICLQFPDSPPTKLEMLSTCDTTLWNFLIECEKEASKKNIATVGKITTNVNPQGYYLAPVLSFLNAEIVGNLNAITFRSLGITKGNSLIKLVRNQITVKNLEEALEEIINVDKQNDSASSPKTSTSASSSSSSQSSNSKMEEILPSIVAEEKEIHPIVNTSESQDGKEEERNCEKREVEKRVIERPTVQFHPKMEVDTEIVEDDIPEGRDLKVYPPPASSEDPMQIDVPDQFYEVRMEDISEQIKKQKEGGALNTAFKSKETREKERIKKMKKFHRSVIRVRFPDRYEIEASFKPSELCSELVKFVAGCLEDQGEQFELYTAPPKCEIASDKSFSQQGLFPTALVYFAWRKSNVTSFLKQELTKEAQKRELAEDPIKHATAHYTLTHSLPELQKETEPESEVVRPTPNPTQSQSQSSKSSASKPGVPKWFTMGKK